MVGALRTAGAQKDRGARPGTGPSGQRSKREVVSDRGGGGGLGGITGNSPPVGLLLSRLNSTCSVLLRANGQGWNIPHITMRSLSSLSFVSLPLRRDRVPPGFYVLPGWALSVLKADILAGHCRPREMAPRSVSPPRPQEPFWKGSVLYGICTEHIVRASGSGPDQLLYLAHR